MVIVFCFKQKTAYEMRISDWSSDVCSSDLIGGEEHRRADQIVGLAEAAQRDALLHVRPLRGIGESILVDVGQARAGEQRIAADAMFAERDRARLNQPPHTRYSRTLMRMILAADPRRDRIHHVDRDASPQLYQPTHEEDDKGQRWGDRL